MKLTTLKKTRVLFCLTCIYGVNHGWAMDEPDKVTGGNGSDSPRDEFHEVTNEEAALYSKLGDENVVTAPPPQKNSMLWDYTLGFVWQTKKEPIVDAPRTALKAEVLLNPPLKNIEFSALTAAALVKTDEDSTQQQDHLSVEVDSDSKDEEDTVNNASNDSSEEDDEGSVNDTSGHEELREIESQSSPLSTTPVVVSELTTTKGLLTLELQVIDPQLLQQSTSVVIEQARKPALKEETNIPSHVANLIDDQEREGSHIFNEGHGSGGVLAPYFAAFTASLN